MPRQTIEPDALSMGAIRDGLLQHRPVTVLGLARSGIALARFLADAGARVTVYDGRPAAELAEAAQDRPLSLHERAEMDRYENVGALLTRVDHSTRDRRVGRAAGRVSVSTSTTEATEITEKNLKVLTRCTRRPRW